MADKVLIIGRMSMKLIMNMYKVPALGETLVDDGGVAYIPGGEGSGSAIAFARLGADALLAGKVGADVHGQRLYSYYRESGINTSLIKVERGEPTALSVVMREGAGERTLLYPGAAAAYTVANLLEALSSMPDCIYVGLGMPWETVTAAVNLAETRGIPVFAEADIYAKDKELSELSGIEVLLLDEDEAFAYSGVMPEGIDASLRASLTIHKKIRAKYIVIRQGERGVFIYDGKRYYVVGAVKAGKCVDRSSEREAFAAAMTVEYLRTGDIQAAVKYGSAAAAITVTREGSYGSIPTDAEVREFTLRPEYPY